MIIKLIRERKDVFWFFGYVLLGLFYYGCKLIIHNYNVVHLPFDDKIPFLPIFIIPYVIWYLYVPGLMIATFLAGKKAFLKQQYVFYSGALICGMIFFIYPTVIDFRPDASGDGFLLWLTRFIYANDVPPSNVFPSFHCYEALSVHLTTFTAGPYKKKFALRTASAVLVILICLSTVFIKQHSYIDVISGCIMAILPFISYNFILRGNKNEYDNRAV